MKVSKAAPALPRGITHEDGSLAYLKPHTDAIYNYSSISRCSIRIFLPTNQLEKMTHLCGWDIKGGERL